MSSIFLVTVNPEQYYGSSYHYAFRDKKNTITTHRIINLTTKDEENCFITKGDNNNTQDEEPVCPNQIEGKLIKIVPVLGSVILFIQKPYGIVIMIMALVIISILIYGSSKEKISKEELEEFKEYKRKKKEEQK